MKASYKHLTVETKYTGSKPSPWSEGERSENWNHHVIRVRSERTKKSVRFDFWQSLSETTIEKDTQALGALCCFLDDALSGDRTFPEWCADLGYDTDSRKAEKAWKACVRCRERALRLFDDEAQFYQIAEEIREIYG